MFLLADTVRAEVRRENGRIVMEESDYRIFISTITELNAEASALRRSLASERASFDEYVRNVQNEREARQELDALKDAKIKRLEGRRWLPAPIVGGGWNTEGDGFKAMVGFGWRLGW